MVRIAAAMHAQMQVHAGFVGQSLHEILHEHRLEIAHPLLFYFDIVGKINAPADIHDGGAQCLVQWHRRLAEPPNPRAVPERLPECASKHDPDVFDHMMVIDMEVAAGLDCEVKEAMASEAREHVVEKRHASTNFAVAATVDLELDGDLGLTGFAAKPRYPRCWPILIAAADRILSRGNWVWSIVVFHLFRHVRCLGNGPLFASGRCRHLA